MSIKAVIIEDEQKSREMLSLMVEKYCSGIEVVGTAEDVTSGLELVRSKKPDLVFLDIELSGETGFDLLEKKFDHKFQVIFTTAFDKYALKAFKYSAVDYLLKPIDTEELKAAVARIAETKVEDQQENLKQLLQCLKKEEDAFQKISLPTGSAYEIVKVNDIVRCESDGHYTYFILTDKRKLLVSISLKHYEEILPESSFVRIHHSHLINMNHVVRVLKVDGGYAVMSDGSQVEISRRKKELFLQKLQSI